jgi:pimeloyl-ACP methyl ester carboxylesterase
MLQPEQQWGAAFKEGHVEADGCRIRYAEAGQGSPVLMLHGAGGLTLSKVHEALAKNYRVMAFEMPGFGRSPANSQSQSVKDLAQTRVALWQALQSPQQVDLLVLIAPTAVLPEGYTMPSLAPDQIGQRMFAHPENAPARPPVDPVTVAKEMALLQRIKGTSRDTELEGKLGEVQTLTLVVFGTADKVVPPEMGRTYRERMPNCHYVMVYDARHAVAAERPEALTNTITDFLDLRETFVVSRRDGRINP